MPDDDDDGDNDDDDDDEDDSSTSHHTKQQRSCVYLHLSFSDLLQRLRGELLPKVRVGF